MEEQLDLVAIGDLATDAFIRLKQAEMHCGIDRANDLICFGFGDKVPYEDVTITPAVGNCPNAAVAAARLGLKSALVTNIGNDHNGREAISSLVRNKVSTKFVKQHADKPTNYHFVLWYQDDRTILIRHEDYQYSLPDIGTPKWIYLSSLGENSLDFHHQIATYLANHPEVKLAFQPGTYQIKLSDKLGEIYKFTEVFFCNVEEAIRILQLDPNPTNKKDVKKLLTGLSQLGPKIVLVTDGVRGAYAYQNGEFYFMPPYPDPKPPLERTGAGDAFASTVISALALGKTLPEALRWGPINSMSVVQKIGAQNGLLSREQLENYLREAPADYQVKKI